MIPLAGSLVNGAGSPNNRVGAAGIGERENDSGDNHAADPVKGIMPYENRASQDIARSWSMDSSCKRGCSKHGGHPMRNHRVTRQI